VSEEKYKNTEWDFLTLQGIFEGFSPAELTLNNKAVSERLETGIIKAEKLGVVGINPKNKGVGSVKFKPEHITFRIPYGVIIFYPPRQDRGNRMAIRVVPKSEVLKDGRRSKHD